MECRLISLKALTAVVALTLMVLTPAWAQAQAPLQYVALGDSYSAGPLDGPFVGNLLCLRSSASYPYFLAAHLGASLTDVSCSGADSSDLTTTAQFPSTPPQVDALSPTTQLVTLTDGGNDNNLFSSAVVDCGLLDLLDAHNIGSPCAHKYGSTFVNDVASDAATVERTLATVKADAPNAQVYVLGYPDILPLTGDCYPKVPLTSGDTAYLNRLELTLNAMIRAQAATAGVHYVSTYAQFIGHGACATRAEQWINAIIPVGNGAPVHPNAQGEQEMATILENALPAGGTS
jgi:lysophospholipase L1-like esterase